MLDAAITAQLRTHLAKVAQPIALVASLDDGPKSRELIELLDEVAALSDRITVEHGDDDAGRPSFAIRRVGTDIAVRFAGIPLGHEFTSFVLALLQVGGHPHTADELLEQVRGARGRVPLRDVLLAVLPELPRRRAGAEPHERAEPGDPPRGHRRGAVPGRGRGPAGPRRAHGVPQRGGVRPGPDEPRADRGPARQRRAASGAARIAEKDPSTSSSSAEVPRVPPPRCTRPARASVPASSRSASAVRCSTPCRSRTSSRCRTPRARGSPPPWSSTSGSTTST